MIVESERNEESHVNSKRQKTLDKINILKQELVIKEDKIKLLELTVEKKK